jgi:hypothetical protein
MNDIKPVAWFSDDLEIHFGAIYPEFSEYRWSPLYPESALLQAKEEGRREGLREAAEICKKEGWKLGIPLHHSEPLIAAITRASEGK